MGRKYPCGSPLFALIAVQKKRNYIIIALIDFIFLSPSFNFSAANGKKIKWRLKIIGRFYVFLEICREIHVTNFI